MIPTNFKEANCIFGPPKDTDESQVESIHAYRGVIKGGNLDGQLIAVVAWKPSKEELEKLNGGESIYLTTFGGLPPHNISVEFPEWCL